MKVHYGTSIPPGLDAPTRGELKVRIERLSLQDELMPKVEGAPLVPVDHCAVSIVFWGDEKAQSGGGGSLVCTPSTDAHVERGVQCCLFPVKTLEAQLVQYLQHMGASFNRGLQLRVSVPPHHSGKRSHVPVGLAIIDLGGLTSSTPLHGWFQVVHHSSEAHCIGRIKVSVALHMFASSDAAVTPPPSTKVMASVKASELQAAAPPPPTTASHDNASAAPNTANADSDTEGLHQMDDVRRVPTPKNGTPPPPPHVTEQPPAEGSTVAALTTPRHHLVNTSNANDDVNLRSWFERGVALRTKMTSAAAASTASYVSRDNATPVRDGGKSGILGSTSLTSPSMGAAWVSGNAVLGLTQRIPMLSGAEHLHEVGLNDSALSDGVVSSSDSEDSERSSSTHGADIASMSRHSHQTQQTRPSVSIPLEGTLRVSIAHIGFSASGDDDAANNWRTQQQATGSPPCEIRFVMRLSNDVLWHDPRQGNSFSSFVHVLPFTDSSRQITLAAGGLRGYTSNSKLVMECIQVFSKPAPPRNPHPIGRRSPPEGTIHPQGETAEGQPLTFLVEDMLQQQSNTDEGQRVLVSERVVGVCIMDLCAQSRRCAFLDPLSGQSFVVCDVVVNLEADPLTPQEQQAELKSRHLPQFTAEDYNDAVASDEGRKLHKKHNHMAKRQMLRASSSEDSCNDVSRSDDGTSKDSDDTDAATTTPSSSRSSSSCSTRRRTRRRHCHRANARQSASPHVVIYHTGADNAERGGGGSPYETTVTVHQRAPPMPLASLLASAPPSRATTAQQSQQHTHKRFHIAIQEAKDLPSVCCVEGDQVSAMLTTTQQSTPYRCDEAATLHRPPTTFVAIDDLYAPRRQHANVDGHEPRSMLLQPSAVIASWHVEAAVQGTGARSSPPVAHNAAPKFFYEAIASIPVDGPLQATTAAAGGNDTHLTHTLGFVDIGVYHDTRNGTTSRPEGHGAGGVTTDTQRWDEEARALQQEREVWRCARLIGTARVDVTPLRYLPVMDGWHRVVSASHAIDTCVGYVRVSIRPL